MDFKDIKEGQVYKLNTKDLKGQHVFVRNRILHSMLLNGALVVENADGTLRLALQGSFILAAFQLDLTTDLKYIMFSEGINNGIPQVRRT